MVDRTSMNDVLIMEIVHCFKNLFYRLRGILLSELALVANAIKQLPAGRKLGDEIKLVLQIRQSWLRLLFLLGHPNS